MRDYYYADFGASFAVVTHEDPPKLGAPIITRNDYSKGATALISPPEFNNAWKFTSCFRRLFRLYRFPHGYEFTTGIMKSTWA
jgi:hypothetical protein